MPYHNVVCCLCLAYLMYHVMLIFLQVLSIMGMSRSGFGSRMTLRQATSFICTLESTGRAKQSRTGPDARIYFWIHSRLATLIVIHL